MIIKNLIIPEGYEIVESNGESRLVAKNKEPNKFFIAVKGTTEPLTYTLLSNDDGEFCVDIEHALSSKAFDDEEAWFAKSELHAHYVLNNPTPWYNAGENSPSHNLDADDYEIIICSPDDLYTKYKTSSINYKETTKTIFLAKHSESSKEFIAESFAEFEKGNSIISYYDVLEYEAKKSKQPIKSKGLKR